MPPQAANRSSLEKAGIDLNAKGGIKVNENMQTVNSNVYAVGDVTGQDMFVYLAAYGGKLAARNALHGNIASRETDGLIKLVADSKTDKLLGATILAPESGDSIQTIVMAIKANFTTEKLASTIFPYLSAVEGLKLAAQIINKDVAKLSCRAG